MDVWLLKTEPAECSIDTLRDAPDGVTRWDGIRNYQARNFLRDRVAVGDLCLIYHSNCREPGLVGAADVARGAYPDPAQFDRDSKYHDVKATLETPRWFCVDVRYREHFARPLLLAEIRQCHPLSSMMLLSHGRLSVQPVLHKEWSFIRRRVGALAA